MKIQIKALKKFHPLVTKKKRVKIIVGGRGSTKTTFVADYVLACMSSGQLWCCGREFQNTIDESVHRTLADEIERFGAPGFTITKTHIEHESGGRNFYRGLSRNILSLKGILSGVDGLWVEEGEGLSRQTLDTMTASVRATAKDFDDAVKAGKTLAEMKKPEIWITMNRRSRHDPIAVRYLERAEPDLQRCGFYEDDEIMVVEANYNDMPKSWFLASGLEDERNSDEKRLTPAAYRNKWLGHYLETVDNAIILQEWFDACIDAHEKLGFKPLGGKILAHDPADTGPDEKAIAIRHGSVVLDVQEIIDGDVNDGCDYALDAAINGRCDAFVWDVGGMGISLKRQVEASLSGKKITAIMFNGAESPYSPGAIYRPADSADFDNQRKNSDYFDNKRAQCYARLRDRILNTYHAVTSGAYVDPDEMISFCSKIKGINKLRSELCSIPQKHSGNGKFKLARKDEMERSPNMADAVMMTMADYQLVKTGAEPKQVPRIQRRVR